MYVGKKIRLLRESLSLNQEDFAHLLNVSQSYYSAIERGKKKMSGSLIKFTIDKWKLPQDYFGEGKEEILEPKNSNKLGVKNGEVSGEVVKIKTEKELSAMHKLFQAYYNKTLNKLPKGLKEINDTLWEIYSKYHDLEGIMDYGTIAYTVDASEFYVHSHLKDFKMPSFDAYYEVKQNKLASLSKYKEAFDRISNDLSFIISTLDSIEGDKEIYDKSFKS